MHTHMPTQNDIPKDSLKFHYGPSDDHDSKGGFTAVSVTATSMTVTFYDAKGDFFLEEG